METFMSGLGGKHLMLCYFNDGFSMRAVDDDYEPETGEVLFEGAPTEAALTAAFSDRAGRLIEETKASAIAEIDQKAGQERAKHITVAPGQDMTYERKFNQAVAFQADPAPTPAKYPAIYNEVGITAADAAGVAAVVIGMNNGWGPLADAIERGRLRAKKQVSEATTLAAIDAALAALSWS
jgi:hypothetical protein